MLSVPPEFVQSVPAITTAVLGSTALIRCEVFGDPAPTVVWYRGEWVRVKYTADVIVAFPVKVD